MADFTHYDPSTGRIVQAGYCPAADLHLQVKAGCDRLDARADPDRDYVDLSVLIPVVAPRPILELPLQVQITAGQTLPITLPSAGTITVDGVAHAVAAGAHDLSALWPGHYQVQVDAWPALIHRMTVTVTP